MNGAIIVYDVAKRTSFEHVRYWLQNIREKGDVSVQICLIGHKTDQSRREVSKEQAQKFALRQRIMYAQTSIKDATSISDAFKKLIGQIQSIYSADNQKRQKFQLNKTDRLGQNVPVVIECKKDNQQQVSLRKLTSVIPRYLSLLSGNYHDKASQSFNQQYVICPKITQHG